jgi:hypothetical protein
VSSIEFAINNLVPNGAPTNFPAQFDVDSVFLEKTKFVRHHERRAIDQRQKTNPQRLSGSPVRFGPGHFFVHFGTAFLNARRPKLRACHCRELARGMLRLFY